MKNKLKFALITGSSRGIGKAIALELAKNNFHIFVHYNSNQQEAKKTALEIEALGASASIHQANLTSINEIQHLFSEIKLKTNVLDVLVNNAGMIISKPFFDFTQKEIELQFNINFFAKFFVTKMSIELLKKSHYPSIINISSRMGNEKTYQGIGVYGPAQAATMKFTKTCALELAQFNIRANCVSPGLVKTDLTKKTMTEEQFTNSALTNPRKRVANPEDIAKIVGFLASKKSDYINGEIINVNGGSNLN